MSPSSGRTVHSGEESFSSKAQQSTAVWGVQIATTRNC
jgi:hypothetical protein